MSGPYVIGCDVGSQGTNCALYSADGTLIASSYQAYDLSFPFPGAAEQDATLWPEAVAAGVREVLADLLGGSLGREGAVVRLTAGRDGGVRRSRPGHCARR